MNQLWSNKRNCVAGILACVLSVAASDHLSAATRTWDGDSDAAWSNGSNWDTLPLDNLTTDTANFNLGGPYSDIGVPYNPNAGTVSIAGITIGASNGAMTLPGNNLSIGSSGITIGSGAGAFTLSPTTVTLGYAQTWTNNDNDAFAVNPTILTRSAGATLNFAGTGGFTTTLSNTATSILGGWATVNGNTWATIIPGTPNIITGLSAYTVPAGPSPVALSGPQLSVLPGISLTGAITVLPAPAVRVEAMAPVAALARPALAAPQAAVEAITRAGSEIAKSQEQGGQKTGPALDALFVGEQRAAGG
jgi:hypothetical protein